MRPPPTPPELTRSSPSARSDGIVEPPARRSHLGGGHDLARGERAGRGLADVAAEDLPAAHRPRGAHEQPGRRRMQRAAAEIERIAHPRAAHRGPPHAVAGAEEVESESEPEAKASHDAPVIPVFIVNQKASTP